MRALLSVPSPLSGRGSQVVSWRISPIFHLTLYTASSQPSIFHFTLYLPYFPSYSLHCSIAVLYFPFYSFSPRFSILLCALIYLSPHFPFHSLSSLFPILLSTMLHLRPLFSILLSQIVILFCSLSLHYTQAHCYAIFLCSLDVDIRMII